MKAVAIAINYCELWHDDDIVEVTVNSWGEFVHQGGFKYKLITSAWNRDVMGMYGIVQLSEL